MTIDQISGRLHRIMALNVTLLLAFSIACPQVSHAAGKAPSRVIRVPSGQPTIQQAVDNAVKGDIVLIAPGVYSENVTIRDKSITLASEFINSRDRAHIGRTVIDGGGGEFVLGISAGDGIECTVMGLTIRNGNDGITCKGAVSLLDNHITGNTDGIDYEDGGGICRGNVFDKNRDDGIDLDGACGIIIEDNAIRDNNDDGIEIRLQPYTGPMLDIVIRENVITGNGEDGIQVIDYPGLSPRHIRIHRNLIAGNAMAGVGCMGDGNTTENYEGYAIPEPIELINNTIIGHVFGVTGGGSMTAVNNIITSAEKTGMFKVGDSSHAAFNLFWKNGTQYDQSNIDPHTAIVADPLLDESSRPRQGSPAIDAGTSRFPAEGAAILDLHPESYTGKAPDLGAFEYGMKRQY